VDTRATKIDHCSHLKGIEFDRRLKVGVGSEV